MQGSVVTTHSPQTPAGCAGALIIQQRRVVALKEVSSLAGSMQKMALYSIDQNHVTVDTMEEMADLLGLLRRQVDALRLDLSSL
ncbi:hypothetical protein AUC61_23780 [Pseudomonas sp. S25]|uniref:Uncharacterized protein n=1 Tax=Pseudomonas maioricensis TaxID=1766623 RepID=A0ABS9ZPQ4_9PSED|nr:hypothetical protein [Pseudomonas sp. S25]MCI8212555.1 hypothetical protein [Pseudomonas sp. S25]